MADSSAVLSAVIAKLEAHGPLTALMTDGVYEDVGPAAATRLVIISQILAVDEDVFGERAWEDAFYLVECRSRDGGNVAAAAAAIDALLAPRPPLPPATLTVAGFELMDIAREEFVRETERDAVDSSIVWKRRGGRYRVRCSFAD